MFRRSALFVMTLFAGAVAQAATPQTTNISVQATGSIGISGATVSGPATFTNGIPNGTFSATVSLSAITSSTVTVPFTVTAGSGNTLSGNITLPAALLLGGGTGTGSAVTTSGTGTYAGDTYTFASLTGTGSLLGTTINLSFNGAGTLTTGGGGGGGGTTPTPTITHVWDAASNTNSLAPGSIFIVQGNNLCPSGTTFYDVPRPTVGKDGVKITFTSGGTGTDALLWYEYNPSGTCQLAGILPSSVNPGSYTVTVTNGSVSAGFATTVVKRKFSLFTQDSTGTGLASVQNYISSSRVDLNSYTTGNGKGTTISPAHPGQFLLAYGTGMGAFAGGDNIASPAFDFSVNGANVQAIIGGMSVPVAYAGRAGYAGEDQINIALPGNVPTGCFVSFQISVDGTLSNATYIAIAPDANAAACVDPGYTTAQLTAFDAGGTYTTGALTILNESATVLGSTVALGEIAGSFERYTAYQLSGASSSGSYTVSTSGSCTVSVVSGTATTVNTPRPTGLDAGNITITGPSGSGLTSQVLTKTQTSVGGVPLISYSLQVGSSGLPIPGAVNGSIVSGTYTFNGAGGADVGAFTGSVTLGAPLVVTGGLPSTVVRSQGLTLKWTGGNSNDILDIVGSAATVSNGVTTGASFVCITTAGAGTFTVPASILNQLPAAATTSGGTGSTSLTVSSGTIATFKAPLVSGGNLDFGVIVGATGVGNSPTYQ